VNKNGEDMKKMVLQANNEDEGSDKGSYDDNFDSFECDSINHWQTRLEGNLFSLSDNNMLAAVCRGVLYVVCNLELRTFTPYSRQHYHRRPTRVPISIQWQRRKPHEGN
jgi:hypothetical protein